MGRRHSVASAPSRLSTLSHAWIQRLGVRGALGPGDLPHAAGFEEVKDDQALGAGGSVARGPAQIASDRHRYRSSSQRQIGAGLLIRHASQVRVIEGAKIGADCALSQVCTIGAGATSGVPNIGDHVCVGPHTCILGPVTIGGGATIAPSSLVLSDVPPGHTAMGVPARILPRFKVQSFRADNVASLRSSGRSTASGAERDDLSGRQSRNR